MICWARDFSAEDMAVAGHRCGRFIIPRVFRLGEVSKTQCSQRVDGRFPRGVELHHGGYLCMLPAYAVRSEPREQCNSDVYCRREHHIFLAAAAEISSGF